MLLPLRYRQIIFLLISTKFWDGWIPKHRTIKTRCFKRIEWYHKVLTRHLTQCTDSTVFPKRPIQEMTYLQQTRGCSETARIRVLTAPKMIHVEQ